jgi:hypothetical protein
VLRILISERHSAAKAQSQAMNQIHGLVVITPDHVRQDYPRYSGARSWWMSLAETDRLVDLIPPWSLGTP